MLTMDKEQLDLMDKRYPGIRKTILCFEQARLPKCPRCGSKNTARVQCGIIGRTINIASATTKFKLMPNPPTPGRYFCNVCNEFFNQKKRVRKTQSKSRPGSLASTLVEVFQGKKKLSLAEAIEAVLAAGHKTKSKNFSTIVGMTLSQGTRFKRVRRGQYALKG